MRDRLFMHTASLGFDVDASDATSGPASTQEGFRHPGGTPPELVNHAFELLETVRQSTYRLQYFPGVG